ncbi:MAG: peptidylprolyl isomerase [Candidatus Magasanikbacteria bacterium]
MSDNQDSEPNKKVQDEETQKKEDAKDEDITTETNQDEDSNSTEKSTSDEVLSSKRSFVYGLIVVIVILLLGGWGFVKYSVNNLSENPTIVKASKVLGIPAATVNGEEIPYSEYVNHKKTLEKFYESQPKNFNAKLREDQVSKQVLSRLIANEVLFQVAEERGVKVTESDINSTKEKLMKKFKNEKQMKETLQKRYGWNMDQYIKNVIRPTVMKRKVKEDYLKEVGADKSVKKEAEKVLEKAKNGEDFEKLAKNNGSKTTQQRAGKLGWFGKGVMVPKFEKVAFSLEPGEVSKDLVKTKFGYHIIKVEDKRTTTTEKGKEKQQIKARHILFQNQNSGKFRQFMNKKLSQADIEMNIPISNPFAAPSKNTKNKKQKIKEKIKKQIQKKKKQKGDEMKQDNQKNNQDEASSEKQ